MATSPPDPHPDSPPQGPSEAPDQLTPAEEPGRESVEDVPEEEVDGAGMNPRSIPLAYRMAMPGRTTRTARSIARLSVTER